MKRQYSLFVKMEGKFKRISRMSFSITRARSLYQNRLIAGSASGLEVRLRPVKDFIVDVDPLYNQAADDFFKRKLLEHGYGDAPKKDLDNTRKS